MYWKNIMVDSVVYTNEYFLENDVCRLCWDKNAPSILFDENVADTTEISLAEIITDYVGIDLMGINLNKICERCCNELKRFYSYKKFCLETDKKLQSILEKGNDLNNQDFKTCLIKNEVIDDTFDKLESFEDDPEFEESTELKARQRPQQVKLKILMNNANFRKKYSHKCLPSYCKTCCLDLKSKEHLESHVIELHGIENNGTIFRCFGCEKRFKNKKNRTSHELNFCHGLKNGFKCKICGRYLPYRSMYEYHMRDHIHNTVTELPEEIFKCRKCVKTFKTNELLKNHMEVEHAKEKTYVCDTCGRVFTRHDYLYKHKLTHTGVKPHHCPHCDFKATLRSSLTYHLRKHTNDRPHIVAQKSDKSRKEKRKKK